jgi:transposase
LPHVSADGGYASPKLEQALPGQGDWTVEIVKRPNEARGFVLIARRWAVDRTGSTAAAALPKTSKPRSKACMGHCRLYQALDPEAREALNTMTFIASFLVRLGCWCRWWKFQQ